MTGKRFYSVVVTMLCVTVTASIIAFYGALSGPELIELFKVYATLAAVISGAYTGAQSFTDAQKIKTNGGTNGN